MKIKSEFVNENFDEYEFAVLCYLSQFQEDITQTYLSPKIILKDLMMTSKHTRNEYENIQSAIKSLTEKQIITVFCSDKEGVYVDIKKIHSSDKEFYLNLKSKNVLSILQINNRNKYLTLKIYAIIVNNLASNISATIDSYTKNRIICQMPQSFLAYKANCSEVTLIKHIKILEEMQLLYVLRDYSNIAGTKGYKRNNNIYCRYEDRAFALSYASNSRGHLMHKKKHEEINAKRSATQKKNYQAKLSAKKAEETTMDDLKQYVRESDDADFIPRDINSMLDALSDHMM